MVSAGAIHLNVLQRQLLADGAKCQECPLGRDGAPSRPVATAWRGPGYPTLALVGEAPGRREIQVGQQFVGASGKMLDVVLAQTDIPRSQIAILNCAACGPIPSAADDTKKAATAACRPRLIAELNRLQPKVVLGLGASALKTLSPQQQSGITVLRGALLNLGADVAGRVWKPKGFFSTYHPAHILRGGDAEADGPGDEGSSAVDLLFYFFLYDVLKAWNVTGACRTMA